MVNKKGRTLTGYTYHTSVHSAKKRDDLKKEFKEQGYNVRTKKKGKNYDIFTKKKRKIKKAEDARVAKAHARRKARKEAFKKQQAKLDRKKQHQVQAQYYKEARKRKGWWPVFTKPTKRGQE